LNSPNLQLRDRALELGAVFGDGRALEELRRTAMGSKADPAARRTALETLIANRAADLPVVLTLLSDRNLASTAVRSLATFDDPNLAQEVINRYKDFRAETRPAVISMLTSRAASARLLLEAVAAKKISRRDISAYDARQIHSLGDESLDKLLSTAWGEFRSSTEEKKSQMASLRAKLTPERIGGAELRRGRDVFLKTCAVCHRLYGEGALIAPELTGSGRADLGYLLENIVDPSAVVAADYRISFVELKDGRTLTGIAGEKREHTMSIQTLTEKITVEQSQVENIQPSALSLMPEGLLDSLSDDEKRDLLGYLMTPRQP